MLKTPILRSEKPFIYRVLTVIRKFATTQFLKNGRKIYHKWQKKKSNSF